MTPDQINGAFELVGSLFAWRNALQLYRDREIRGVYWPIWAFFALWGLWNLAYYPALGQWWSFAGGCSLVAGNLAWTAQAVRLRWPSFRLQHFPCLGIEHAWKTAQWHETDGIMGYTVEGPFCQRCGRRGKGGFIVDMREIP